MTGSVVDSSPARVPQRVTLEGRLVSVRPLSAAAHADSLYGHACGPDALDVWTYLPDGPYHDRTTFAADMTAKERSRDPLYFTIVNRDTGEAVGHAALMRIDATHRVIEVGHVLFSPRLQRTAAATEAMYLMARYVFEELGYRRYEWKCDSLNAVSRRAAERLGFTFEGIFRQHMIRKGRNRDTAWYSMLDSEWPAVKAAFEAWLDPRNFDDAGTQRRSLSDVRSTPAPQTGRGEAQ